MSSTPHVYNTIYWLDSIGSSRPWGWWMPDARVYIVALYYTIHVQTQIEWLVEPDIPRDSVYYTVAPIALYARYPPPHSGYAIYSMHFTNATVSTIAFRVAFHVRLPFASLPLSLCFACFVTRTIRFPPSGLLSIDLRFNYFRVDPVASSWRSRMLSVLFRMLYYSRHFMLVAIKPMLSLLRSVRSPGCHMSRASARLEIHQIVKPESTETYPARKPYPQRNSKMSIIQ